MNYNEFAKKFDNTAAQTDLNYYVSEPINKLKSHSDWINTKKTFIKDTNTYSNSENIQLGMYPRSIPRGRNGCGTRICR